MRYIDSRIKSFKYAYKGVKECLNEANYKIHLIIALITVLSGILIRIDKNEWTAIILAIVIVIVCETFNTAIESLSDMITLEKNDQIRKIKDIAASGVLISSIGAAIIGMIIFIPYIFY